MGTVVSFNDDITERKKAERSLRRSNRALQALSAANEALVCATDEATLLQEVCRIAVEVGDYRVAFVGFAEDDAEKTVSIAAQHGAEMGYLESLGFTWADTDKGQSTVGRAIRSGVAQMSQNIMTDPKLAPWYAAVARLGSRASISLPLKAKDGKVFGMLTIGAAETDAFDADEVKLLGGLAADLAFGIEALRTRAERDRIAHQHAHHAEILQKSLEKFIQAIADTVEARDPYTAGHQRRVDELATAIARELGLAEDKIHGIHLAAIIHDLGKIHVPSEILSKPGKLTDIEFMLIKAHPQAGYDILKNVDSPLAYRRHRPPASREAGWLGLPAGAEGRADPARIAHHVGGGHSGGDGLAPALSAGAGDRGRPQGDRARPRQRLRSGGRRCLPETVPGRKVRVSDLKPERQDCGV